MGMERFLAWVLRHGDIRDLVIMPRIKGTEFLVSLYLLSLLYKNGGP